MDKDVIRRESLSKRDLLLDLEKEEKSRQIFERLIELPCYQQAENILVYASIKSEVITGDIILDALSYGKKVFCPKVTDKDRSLMEFIRILSPDDLEKGYFNVPEPLFDQDSEVYKGEDSGRTLMIMPGAAFDLSGNRVGYGAGFYDRYLNEHKDIKNTLAISYDCQIYDVIDCDECDVKINMLVTESTVYDFSGKE